MSVLTAVCWGIFLFVANLIDPTATNWLGFMLFYFSLFIALSGIAALSGFLIRFVALKKELAFNLVKVAFRQSFLFALFLTAALFLKANHLFNGLNLLLLILGFSILELFLISYNHNRQ
jgi:hypothetical protein